MQHDAGKYTLTQVNSRSAFKRLANGSELTKDSLRLKTKSIDPITHHIWQMFDKMHPKTALLQSGSKAQPKRYLTEGGIEDCKGVPHLAARNCFHVMANHWIWLDFTLPPFHPSKGKAWKYALALLQKVGNRTIHMTILSSMSWKYHIPDIYLTYISPWNMLKCLFSFLQFFFKKPASQFFVELCLQLSPLFRRQLSQAATGLPLMRPQLRCFSRFSLDPKTHDATVILA